MFGVFIGVKRRREKELMPEHGFERDEGELKERGIKLQTVDREESWKTEMQCI